MTEPMPFADAYRAARTRAVLLNISDRGKVEVIGPEAAVFLHNLTSNDIKGLAYSHGVEAFLCNVQARVLGHGWVWHLKIFEDHLLAGSHESFWIDLDPGLGAKMAAHLDRHLISEQAEIFDRTEAYSQLHLAGPRAPELMESLGVSGLADGQLMQAGWGEETTQFRRRDRLGLPGFDIVARPTPFAALWNNLFERGAEVAGPEVYEVLRIEAGTPLYGTDLDETQLAPEVNRTKQAISYTKGCYLGQEPIVRVRDLGHVNRVLLGLTAAGDAPLPRSARLWREGKEVGQVTSSAVSPRLGTIALAYVRRGSTEPGTAVEVETPTGRVAAAVSELPFQGPAA